MDKTIVVALEAALCAVSIAVFSHTNNPISLGIGIFIGLLTLFVISLDF